MLSTTSCVALYVLVCLLLLVVVLLQQGKGGDIAAAFGGSSSQTAFGARAGRDGADARDDDPRRAVHGGRVRAGRHEQAAAAVRS